MRELCNWGANINIQTLDSGNSPLHIAANRGYCKAVRICLENGADFTRRNGVGATPREVVKRRGSFKKILLGKSDTEYLLDRMNMELEQAHLEIRLRYVHFLLSNAAASSATLCVFAQQNFCMRKTFRLPLVFTAGGTVVVAIYGKFSPQKY